MVQRVARGINVRDGCAVRCGVPKGVGLALVSKAGVAAQTRSPGAEDLRPGERVWEGNTCYAREIF